MSNVTCKNCNKEVPEELLPVHDLDHKLVDTQAALAKTHEGVTALTTEVAALRQGQQQVFDSLASWDPRHASLEEIKAHTDDGSCPECAAIIAGLTTAAPAPEPEPEPVVADPSPTPEPEPEPGPEPEPTPITFPSPSEMDISALALSAYGIEYEEDDTGKVTLIAKDEELAKEAIESGAMPNCRWVRQGTGGYIACEPE